MANYDPQPPFKFVIEDSNDQPVAYVDGIDSINKAETIQLHMKGAEGWRYSILDKDGICWRTGLLSYPASLATVKSRLGLTSGLEVKDF